MTPTIPTSIRISPNVKSALPVGARVGNSVGFGVVGCAVGSNVGDVVGAYDVGRTVGSNVGDVVGAYAVGRTVGAAVGLNVGDVDGGSVGGLDSTRGSKLEGVGCSVIAEGVG